MAKYRDRPDIIASILRVVANAPSGYASFTKIMYGAYLSYEQLKEYLAVLVPNGLIVRGPTIELYKITPKGTEFLNAYDGIQDLLNIQAQKPDLKYHQYL